MGSDVAYMKGDGQIIRQADASMLVRYSWPGRGIAPTSYIRGMSIALARLFNILKSDDDGSVSKRAVDRATASQIGASSVDVLAWYSPELAAAGAATTTAKDKLVALFTILLGLGMRESSGRHCVGADTPEDRQGPTTEANAEAGLFQVSYDSIRGDHMRQSLFDAYTNRTDLLEIFSEGVTCSIEEWANCGKGAGGRFQKTMKECPLFAVLYTAQFIRGHRKHWGPINRKEVDVRFEAVELFNSICGML